MEPKACSLREEHHRHYASNGKERRAWKWPRRSTTARNDPWVSLFERQYSTRAWRLGWDTLGFCLSGLGVFNLLGRSRPGGGTFFGHDYVASRVRADPSMARCSALKERCLVGVVTPAKVMQSRIAGILERV